jgi:hypothetical protein
MALSTPSSTVPEKKGAFGRTVSPLGSSPLVLDSSSSSAPSRLLRALHPEKPKTNTKHSKTAHL